MCRRRARHAIYSMFEPSEHDLCINISVKSFKNQVFILRSAVKMKKMVLKLSMKDEKSRKRVFTAVAGVEGVDLVTMDIKEEKITLIGYADPVPLTLKLRKIGHTELLSVGLAKEEEKEAPKQEQKKDEKNSEPVPTIVYYTPPYEYNAVSPAPPPGPRRAPPPGPRRAHSGKYPRLTLVISPPQPEIKDAETTTDPSAEDAKTTTDPPAAAADGGTAPSAWYNSTSLFDGWTAPSPRHNLTDAWTD